MGNGMMYGAAIGVAVGLIICVIVFKWFNKDHKVKTQYDEMQEKERGNAYKYAFWAALICEAVLAVISMGDVELPFSGVAVHFLVIFVSVIVQASYSIWHNAYRGMNTNTARFAVFAVIISIINFIPPVMAIAAGEFVVDGKLQTPFINLLCGLMFIIIGVEILIKRVVDKTAPEEE